MLLHFIPPITEGITAYTPVHVASQLGQMAMVQQLLNAGWPLTTRNSDGQTALHLAAAGGWKEITKLLVKRGLNPSDLQDDPPTPLEFAVVYGKHKVESWLAKRKDAEPITQDRWLQLVVRT